MAEPTSADDHAGITDLRLFAYQLGELRSGMDRNFGALQSAMERELGHVRTSVDRLEVRVASGERQAVRQDERMNALERFRDAQEQVAKDAGESTAKELKRTTGLASDLRVWRILVGASLGTLTLLAAILAAVGATTGHIF